MVDEERERRGFLTRLRDVVHLETALAIGDGVAELTHIGKELVQLRSGDMARATLGRGIDHIPDLVDAAAGHGGNAQILGPGRHGQAAIDRLHDGLALVVVLEEVPLVEEYHQGTAALDREISNLLVLLRHARGGVDDEQRDVRAIDSAEPSDHGVVLDILIDRALLTDARGIDHAITLAVALDNRVDGIARGTGDIAHDGAVIADHLIEERGLAGVRSADDGDAQRIGLVVLVARVLGQQGDDLVEQVAGAVAVQGGDGDGVTHAQGVELPKAVVLTGGIVELVDEQESRCSAHASDGRAGGGR